jgi:hypothetical protein
MCTTYKTERGQNEQEEAEPSPQYSRKSVYRQATTQAGLAALSLE